MKRIVVCSILAGGLAFAASPQLTPPDFNKYHSQDEFLLANSLFRGIRADLDQAQADSPATFTAGARAELDALQQQWKSGVYESRQVDAAISAIRRLADDPKLSPGDRHQLAVDWTRLLDFRKVYY